MSIWEVPEGARLAPSGLVDSSALGPQGARVVAIVDAGRDMDAEQALALQEAFYAAQTSYRPHNHMWEMVRDATGGHSDRSKFWDFIYGNACWNPGHLGRTTYPQAGNAIEAAACAVYLEDLFPFGDYFSTDFYDQMIAPYEAVIASA